MVTGVVASKKLISQTQLSKARSLTNSSPTTAIKGLVFWVESTSRKSFSNENPNDGDTIDLWKDINPTSVYPRHLKQATSGVTTAPIYQRNGINGLPSLLFSKVDNPLGVRLVTEKNEPTDSSSELTIFIVLQPQEISTILNQSPLGFRKLSDNEGYFLQSNTDSFASRIYNGTSTDIAFATVSDYESAIVTVSYDSSTSTHSISKNGGTPDNNFPVTYQPVDKTHSQKLYIGIVDNLIYNGLISEIIIYDRALDDDQKEYIETYLSRKYKISLI